MEVCRNQKTRIVYAWGTATSKTCKAVATVQLVCGATDATMLHATLMLLTLAVTLLPLPWLTAHVWPVGCEPTVTRNCHWRPPCERDTGVGGDHHRVSAVAIEDQAQLLASSQAADRAGERVGDSTTPCASTCATTGTGTRTRTCARTRPAVIGRTARSTTAGGQAGDHGPQDQQPQPGPRADRGLRHLHGQHRLHLSFPWCCGGTLDA